jgi:hypothetical protein
VEHLIGVYYMHLLHIGLSPYEPRAASHPAPRRFAMEMTLEKNSHIPCAVLTWFRPLQVSKLVATAEVYLYIIGFVLLLGGGGGSRIIWLLACHRSEYIHLSGPLVQTLTHSQKNTSLKMGQRYLSFPSCHMLIYTL